MSTDVVRIRTGVYHDSVSLMRVSQALTALPGVEVAIVAMATELNLDTRHRPGLRPSRRRPRRSADRAARRGPDVLESADAELERLLTGLAGRTHGRGRGRAAAAHHRAPPPAATDATLALVSVPGQYAFAEAMDAVEAGLSVMIFSDNVPVEQEVLLKKRAGELDVLVMGPDCGTAVIGGVGLGFANVLRPGPVGVVAASGTGAQQVTCLLDLAGVGVSHVLGVGGRDLSAEVGGRSTLRALRALDADPATELIVLISKPPAPEVAAAVREAVAKLGTPVVTALLGPGQGDLTAAAETALRALGRTGPRVAVLARHRAEPSGRDRVGRRGLGRCGALLGRHAVRGGPADRRDGEFTDFGDDAYTRGRPHPMIDPSLRLEALAEVPPGASCCSTWCSATAPTPIPRVRLAPRSPRPSAGGCPWSSCWSAPTAIRRAWTPRPRRCTRPGPPCSRPTRGPPRYAADVAAERRRDPLTRPRQESSMTLPMLSGEPRGDHCRRRPARRGAGRAGRTPG